MIGIIGPRDSVALVRAVAEDLGRGFEVVGAPYKHVEQTVDLARSLEASCDALLFTGQVPYQRARVAGPWRRSLHVISHSGADLYRMIGLILKERGGGEFPRVSVDALEQDTVRRVFRDMRLRPPEVVIPVVDGDEFVFPGIEGTTRAHRQAIESGKADAALTCLAQTHTQLRAAGLPTWRIDHARVTVVEALERAWLAGEVTRTRGNSLAVIIVACKFDLGRSAKRMAVARAALERAVESQARRLSGQVLADGDEWTLITTQGAVAGMIERHHGQHKSLIDAVTSPPEGVSVTLGIGVGHTFGTAQDGARKALQIAASAGDAAIAYEDGSVDFFVGGPRALSSLQETSSAALDLVQRTGLGALSLRRLVDALGRAEGPTITAQQLGEYYGVMPRSARRMLAALVAAGFAREAGVRAAVVAGRPHVLYEVDVHRLRGSLAGTTLPQAQ